MQLIADGTVTGAPNPYLYLSSTKIGRLLNALYNSSSHVNWYYYYLLTCYALFLTFIVVYLLDNSKNDVFLKTILCVLIYVMGLVKIQFTIIAVLLCFLSFLYYSSDTENPQDYRNSITASLLLIVSGLIRVDVVFVFMFLFMPLLGWKALVHQRYLGVFCAVAIMAALIGNNVIEKAELTAISGFDVDKYVKSTETIIDNPNSISESDLTEHGLNLTDLALLKGYFFIDTDVFSYQTVTSLSQGKLHYRDMSSIFAVAMFSIYNMWAFVIVTILVFRTCRLNTERNTLFALMFLIIMLATVLIVFVRFPYHISSALILIVLYYLLIRTKLNLIKKGWAFLLAGVCCTYIGVGAVQNGNKNEMIERSFDYFNKNQHLQYQFSMFTDIPLEAMAGPVSMLNDKPNNRLFFGWLIGTPAYVTHVNRLYEQNTLLYKNQFQHLISDPKVRLLSNNNTFNDDLIKFAKNHYSRDIKLIKEDSVFETNVYRID